MSMSAPVVRRRVIDGNAKLERAKQRRVLGTLSSLVVTARTAKRYDDAVRQLFAFMKTEKIRLPSLFTEFDDIVCQYIELCWHEGEGRSLVSNTLAGLQHFCPAIRHHLPCSWRLVSAWQRHELPARAAPFTRSILLAVAGKAMKDGDAVLSVALLVAFEGMLRTGELFNLACKDCVVTDDGKSVVLNLGMTKGGARRGAAESVVLYDPLTVDLLRARVSRAPPYEKLVNMPSAAFRQKFNSLCNSLDMGDIGYKPYSLRRGGTTHHFQTHASMSSTCVRGRWGDEKTARVYINEGLAALASTRLSPNALKLCESARKHLTKVWKG